MKETPMTQTSKPQVGRPILRFPPAEELPELPPCEWNELPEYPILMTQWVWGVQALWDPKSSVFVLPEELPSDFAINQNGPPLMQIRVEGIEPEFGRSDLAWGWFYDGSNNRRGIFNQLIANRPSPELNFWLTDFDIKDTGAAGRAYFVVNSKSQKGVKICQACQVPDQSAYMTYFDKWKVQGFVGAVCQQYQAPYSDTHFLSDLYTAKLKG